MTPEQRAAMEQAREALKNAYWPTEPSLMPAHNIKECEKAIDALTAVLADNALNKMAENAREIGLDYEPAQQKSVATIVFGAKHSFSNIPEWAYPNSPQAREPEQPAQQEPVAWVNWCAATGKRSVSFECESELASEPLYAGITQNTQGHYSKFHSWFDSELHRQKYTKDHPAYLAAQKAWNAANDDAQHRINRLSAEIEAWKARFKIAEDALVKLNGMEGAPVAWMYDIARYGPTDLRGQQWRPAISRTKPNIHDSLVRNLTPLYTASQPAMHETNWKDMYEKQKRKADMWVAKYEADIGPVEKAGPVAAQEEPVAWMTINAYGEEDDIHYENPEGHLLYGWTYKPLYTHPQAREWVGLTDEEIRMLIPPDNGWKYEIGYGEAIEFARAIEAKLREKNA